MGIHSYRLHMLCQTWGVGWAYICIAYICCVRPGVLDGHTFYVVSDMGSWMSIHSYRVHFLCRDTLCPRPWLSMFSASCGYWPRLRTGTPSTHQHPRRLR
jgi:hypothetical protein